MRCWKVENGGNTTIESQRLLHPQGSWILTVPSQSCDLASCWPWIVTCNEVLSPLHHHCSFLSSTMSAFNDTLSFFQSSIDDSPKSVVIKNLKAANDFMCNVANTILDDKDLLREEQGMWLKEWNMALVHSWLSHISYNAKSPNRINSMHAFKRLENTEQKPSSKVTHWQGCAAWRIL